MAFDCFLKIEGLAGGSIDPAHEGSIEIEGYNLAAHQSISRLSGSTGGATTGRVYLSDFSIAKLVDTATPKLFESCCSGQHFKTAILSAYRAGDNKQKYMEVIFEDIIISAVYSGNLLSTTRTSFPEEVICFSYATISMTYSQQSRKTGQLIGQISASWDQSRNNTYA